MGTTYQTSGAAPPTGPDAPTPSDTSRTTSVAVRDDHATLDDQALTDRFRELELTERRLVAERALLLAEAEQRQLHRTDNHHSIAGWLRAHLDWSSAQITQARRLARLTRELPVVADALLAGRIGVAQADELARLFANPRCGHQLAESIDVLVDLAHRLPYAEFRICARRWETLADLDGAHRHRGASVEARTATVTGDHDGVDLTASGGTALEAAEMSAIFRAFTQTELDRDLDDRRRHHGDDALAHPLPRTDRQRRFDALVAIFRTANTSTGTPLPAPATVNIVVDHHTFEAAAARHHLAAPPDDLAAPDPAHTHCHTSTGIALLPDDTLTAALHGHVRRVVIDSAGLVTDLGRRQRLYAGAVRDAAKLLAHTCQYPGCTVPADVADVDHLAEWTRHHGRTSTRNATILCGRHNRWKHTFLQARRDHHGQLHFQRPDGTWLTPVGRPPPEEADLLPLDTG